MQVHVNVSEPLAAMLCGPDGLTVQLASSVAGAVAFELTIVSAVGVMPDTAVDDVIVITTWIVAGLAERPVTSTGAESDVRVGCAGASPAPTPARRRQ